MVLESIYRSSGSGVEGLIKQNFEATILTMHALLHRVINQLMMFSAIFFCSKRIGMYLSNKLSFHSGTLLC